MNYPLISEYIDAIRYAEDNFDELSYLRPVLDGDGNPVMSSGNFAVVFKMTDGKKDYAIKCFTREQEGRVEAYKQISKELEFVSSPFMCGISFFEKELFVDTKNSAETEFPVLQMDWVEGVPLDEHIRRCQHDKYELEKLAFQFCQMAQWLISQPFAHGDLKPDNILVKDDGTLVLVDYDGMFVPAMKGEKARELGNPNYRHPLRTEEQFNEHIDDFALASIALALKAIALNPDLYNAFGAANRLLFLEEDFRNLGDSKLVAALQALMVNTDFLRIYSLFMIAYTEQGFSNTSSQLFRVCKPNNLIVISTKATDEDWTEAWTDKYGVKYSKDGKKLLSALLVLDARVRDYTIRVREYTIKEGTEVICDGAFSPIITGSYFQRIIIPNTVTHIGDKAFSGCSSLQSIAIPDFVISIGDSAFSGCSSLQSVNIPNSVTSIGNELFRFCTSLQRISIPATVTKIGNEAFSGCLSLQSINIPKSVTCIGDEVFNFCKSLRCMTIPESVTSIGEAVFSNCNLKLTIKSPHFFQ